MTTGTVLILGIDTVLRKNLLQLESGNELGYRFLILTNDSMGTSSRFSNDGCQVIKAETSYLRRFFQAWKLLHTHRKSLNHVEVYPGGRFAPLYVLLAKLYSLPLVVVERGDLLGWMGSKGWYRRLISFVYRSADIVWFKEYYMERVLRDDLGTRRLFFLANALGSDQRPTLKPFHERTLDFVWANRLVKQRMPEWFIAALQQPQLAGKKSAIIGVIHDVDDALVREKQTFALAHANECLEVREYSNPLPYFENARFFVLAADVVFGNNALFEAMSHGAIPIISAQEHTDEIVPGPQFGFRFAHAPENLRDAMIEAINTPFDRLEEISRNAQEHVFAKFGRSAWRARLAELYQEARVSRGRPQ